MSQRIPPAIYQFFPFGTQEKILLEDAADGVYFDFQEATADDKLYIQLFDQGFQHPPSKLYRSDATITGDIIEMTCHFEVDAPCVVQLFKMQYGQKKRMGSETETVTLTNETVVHVQTRSEVFQGGMEVLARGELPGPSPGHSDCATCHGRGGSDVCYLVRRYSYFCSYRLC